MLALSRSAKYLFASTFLLLIIGCRRSKNEGISIQRAEQHLQAAIRYLKQGREEEVIREYKTAIKLSPLCEREMQWSRFGKLCLQLEKYNEAESAFQSAIDINPTSLAHRFWLGFTCYKLYKDDEAEKHFKKILELNPEYPNAYFCLGMVYLRQDKRKDAQDALLRAVAQNPQNAEAYYQLGLLYSKQKDAKKALRNFKEAVHFSPDVYSYHYRLGYELLRSKKLAEGLKELNIYRRLYKKIIDEDTADRKKSESGRYLVVTTRNIKDGISLSSSKIASPLLKPQEKGSLGFINVTESAGIYFKHYNDAKETATILETTGSGAAFCDYDNDGNLDIYLINCSKLNPSDANEQHRNALWRNRGDGTFIEVTEKTGVGNTIYGMGCAFSDYDNDGDDDLYITNYGENVLYRNNGDGSFTDVTNSAGVGNALWGTSCAFTDYDNDGDLDLYVCNYVDFKQDGLRYCYVHNVKTACPPVHYAAQPDILYRNNGDGTFTDVTKEAGLYNEDGMGLGVAFGDYDNDGDQDIYIANDSTENFLYRNNGDGTFKDVALVAGVSCDESGMFDSGMGVDFGDYDNDGYLDIFITNFQNLANTLYHNRGNKFFTDVSYSSGLGRPSLLFLGFGTKFFDYNNDGYLDIFVANGHVQDNVNLFEATSTYRQRNQLFINNHDGTFSEVTNILGDGFAIKKASRGAAFGDYDNDGDTDILVSNSNDTPTLLQNEEGNKNNFLAVKTIGVTSNRNGIGTRVKVKCGQLTQIREVRSGSGYLSDHDRRLLFGVANYGAIESVELRWPSGITQRFENVSANQLLVVKENSSRRKF